MLQQLTRGGMGTEYYCSLEQWNTGKCNETGDIYSLGVMLAELIRGQQLPMTYVGMGISQDVVSNNTYGAQLLNTIIKTMTHFLPQSRVQSMEVVARQLRECPSPSPPPLYRQYYQKHWLPAEALSGGE